MTTPSLAPSTTSISQPIGPIDRRLADAIAVILNTAERVAGVTVVRQLPSPRLIADITVRQHDLRRALAPLERSVAEKERAAKAVAAVLSGWVMAKVADPAAKVSAYIAVLGDLPCWVVEQVCRDVARGHVDGLDPDFPPSAARLHQLGEDVIARLRKEAGDLAAVKDAKLTAEPAPGADERARIALGFQQLGEELKQGDKAAFEARQKLSLERDKEALAAGQERVRREYAAIGQEPPSPLALSVTARRELGISPPAAEESAA